MLCYILSFSVILIIFASIYSFKYDAMKRTQDKFNYFLIIEIFYTFKKKCKKFLWQVQNGIFFFFYKTYIYIMHRVSVLAYAIEMLLFSFCFIETSESFTIDRTFLKYNY